jgi:predicted phosphoribosyltransferase
MARAIRFDNRRTAGRQLAHVVRDLGYASRRPTVLALPRGGVPVGYEIARALRAPLDAFVVRKLGVPGQEELALGAVASGGVRVLNGDVIESLGLPDEVIDEVAWRELREIERREFAYREGRPAPHVGGRTALLVDDGLATGATMRAAVAAVRRAGPERVVVAVPVASPEAYDALRRDVDDLVCLFTPEPFRAVGLWYRDFRQTEDDEVRALLARAAFEVGAGRTARPFASPA